MINYKLDTCLCCSSPDLRVTLDLGTQPLANDFSPPGVTEVDRFPLGLMTCRSCWHSQLSYCVSRERIFKNYAYASGTSNTLRNYFNWFARSLGLWLPAGSRVLDIAANDGSFVSALISSGIEALGIDPASNLVKEAEAKHLPIIEGYWPKDAGRVNGTFEAIVCMNVLAHVDKPKDFLEACEKALAPGGVIIIQPSQARMFENCEFDTCYHEHISFFNSRSINALANSVGLELKATSLVKIHGDSPVYFLAKKNDRAFKDPSPFFRIGDFAIDEDLFAYENRVGIFNSKTYDDFSNRSQLVLRRFKKQVEDHRALGYQIVFVGAAAKAMTVINASGVKPDFFLDEALLKIGKIAPGVGVVIEGLHALEGITRPAFIVLTAWNFKVELLRKISEIGVSRGSRYYCYFPAEELDLV